MRCWRCGQEVTDGASLCVACGASLERAVPTTEAGRAMREIYDRYGAEATLGDPAYLGNGLGDVLQDSAVLRSRLRMAVEVGVGRLYLEQIRDAGAPDAAFAQRVRTLLVGDAGLSDAVAGKVASLLDEMVGWQAAPEKKAATTQPQEGDNISPFALVEEMGNEEKAPGTNGSQERSRPAPAPAAPSPLQETPTSGNSIIVRRIVLVLFWLIVLECLGGGIVLVGLGISAFNVLLLGCGTFLLIVGIWLARILIKNRQAFLAGNTNH